MRIKENMGIQDIIVAMSDGNPGALTVMSQCVQQTRLDTLMLLDVLEIYGPDIWVLYKDVHGQDINKFIAGVDEKAAEEAPVGAEIAKIFRDSSNW